MTDLGRTARASSMTLEQLLKIVPQPMKSLEIGREYYWKRTDGWKWIDGEQHWWEIFITVDGYNGVGGYWLVERWRWNGSSETLKVQPRTISYDESALITAQILAEQIFRHCQRCGHAFEDERDRVLDIGGYRCIADGKCWDRAMAKTVRLVGEELSKGGGNA